jgi:hypothetical protein
MDKLFIIHFQPLEKYPPAINLIRYLATINTTCQIHVVSTDAADEKKLIEIAGISLHRLGKWNTAASKWGRVLLYCKFNLSAFWLLLRQMPKKVFYYETLSAAAPYFYKQWINRRSELYIHYHEYSSIAEYKSGMKLNRAIHSLEKRLYKKAKWVSHTNRDRLNLFTADLNSNAPTCNYILPNYPPHAWKNRAQKSNDSQNKRTAFVYVGALGMETMYIKEFSAFIKAMPDKCYWDIYSDNFSSEVLNYFDSLNASNIYFKGAVKYDALPEVLSNYDVGVILYNGHIPNYIYNAPNKLFEYLVCGLDVWFPHVMKSCFNYVTSQTYPKVLPVDFSNLISLELDKSIDRRGLKFKEPTYYCETVLYPLAKQLIQNV